MLLGAYTYAIFTIPLEQRESVYQYFQGGAVHFTVPVPVALIFAGLAAAFFAFLIGLPVLRLKSDYLAIATLGFAEIIRAIFQWNQLGPITNGSNMLRMFPNFNYFNIRNASGEVTVYLSTTIPFIIAGVCIALIVLLIHSGYGRAFKAIRDDEIAAEAMGINLAHHKQLAFSISSFFAGVGGAMLAMYQTTVQAKSFTSAMTYEILLIVVIGGVGSVTGSVSGTGSAAASPSSAAASASTARSSIGAAAAAAFLSVFLTALLKASRTAFSSRSPLNTSAIDASERLTL